MQSPLHSPGADYGAMLAPSLPGPPPAAARPSAVKEDVRAATAGNPDADDPWDAWSALEIPTVREATVECRWSGQMNTRQSQITVGF